MYGVGKYVLTMVIFVNLAEATSLCILQGGGDRCIKPACGQSLYKRSKSTGKKNVTYKEFPGEGHDTESAYDFLITGGNLLQILETGNAYG